MRQLYPLNPVIMNNEIIKHAYNGHFDATCLMSEGLSVEQACELIQNGAQFDKVVLVNGEGQELIPLVGNQLNWDDEQMPEFLSVTVDTQTGNFVKTLCDKLKQSNSMMGMG